MAAGKKRVDHVAWQIEVANNEEWEELIKLQGLVVVDVYSEWCGPCSAMASHLKEIKLQLGDDLLHCALAKADCISQLSRFRGRSEPTWLFLAGGEPVSLIRGANAPLIRKTLLAELKNEKEVLEGIRQRTSVPWDSFDLPNSKTETEEINQNEIELTTAPDNWLELDGLTLKGSYRLIIDKLLEAMAEKNMDISARSSVRLHKKDCLILWFPSSVEDETLAEWFDVTIKNLIAEVEPKKPVKEEEPEDELTDKIEGIELAENVEQSESPNGAEVTEEESTDYQPIEFHLISDTDEKETLIKQLEKESSEEEEEADNETPVVEEAAEEEEEKQPEEKVEEPVENAAEIEQVDENIAEPVDST